MWAGIVKGESTNPCYNLAYEEYLLRYAQKEDCMLLYLWQNYNVVIIGRNQNAYTECSLWKLEACGGKLVRRMTGGGAVYHDLGNLNYTFIMPKRFYDIEKTTKVIADAIEDTGIAIEISGRNDILASGYKFSGNAYYSNEAVGMHHGTIMVDVDLDRMNELLSVSGGKLSHKGMQSVRSRVKNLSQLKETITIEEVADKLCKHFQRLCSQYRAEIVPFHPEVDEVELAELLSRYDSKKWNIEQIQEYSLAKSERFSWGHVCVSMNMQGSNIESVMISSDSLYPDLMDEIQRKLNKLVKKQTKEEEPAKLYQRMKRDVSELKTDTPHIQSEIYQGIIHDIGSIFKQLINSLEE